ncbi:porin [Thauera sp. 2A1]|uniref:porin n=1 Tax=Thauera sp. 2A1 TaxID=2570191 RepID=UPI001290F6BC|nr:porin [Thauera sp. 2A1]KAI5913262.1 porin [Thauera sp. 2A1]
MQKKLIALAVAGLVSVPAFAQSNVTIYGVVDMGYKYQGDNVASNVKNRNAIDSGISGGSRIGFKGTEDLGNGLKAGFVLEQGIAVDTGSSPSSGTWARQSFVSLSGGFGAVALGRQYTPQHKIMAAVDPFGFGKGTAAGLQNFYIGEARLDNLVAYVSPTWSGFNVAAGYTFGAGNGNGAGTNEANPTPRNNVNTTDVRAWVISPSYTNGPIFVAANFHKLDPVQTGVDSAKVWDLAGTYDFGMVKVGAIYGQRKIDDAKVKQWALTGAVPVGPAGKVQVMYGQRKFDEGGNTYDGAKVSQWGLGYEHALSKRTALYAVYAQQNQNNDQERATLGTPNQNVNTFTGLGAGIGDASDTGAGNYQRGFNLGVRHSF